MTTEVFIGIDVARDSLEIAVRSTGEQWQIGNDAAGIATLVPRLRVLRPTLIVLEATGGFELPALAALGSAGLLSPRGERKSPPHCRLSGSVAGSASPLEGS